MILIFNIIDSQFHLFFQICQLELILLQGLEHISLTEGITEQHSQVVQGVHHCFHLPGDEVVEGDLLCPSILLLGTRQAALGPILRGSPTFWYGTLFGCGLLFAGLGGLAILLFQILLENILIMLHVICLNDSIAHDLFDQLLGSLIDLVDQSLTTGLNTVERGAPQ